MMHKTKVFLKGMRAKTAQLMLYECKSRDRLNICLASVIAVNKKMSSAQSFSKMRRSVSGFSSQSESKMQKARSQKCYYTIVLT